MENQRQVIILFILHVIVVLVCAHETVTENVKPVEEEGTTNESEIKGRALSSEENSIEPKSKRNPKFGFTIPFPNIPGSGGDNTTPGPGGSISNPDNNGFGGFPGDVGTTATLGTTAVLIKGGILSGLTALKAAIIPPIFLGAVILFLIAGAAFFTCSVINCGRIVGDFGGPGINSGFGSSSFSPFNRNGFEEYEQRPVYQGIDEGYKKFN